MLKSSLRLTTPLFNEVMDKGKLVHSPLFSAKFLKVVGPSRYAVAVSKKVAKKATDRNKVRRRVYSALRMFPLRIQQGIHAVFMPKESILKTSFKEIAVGIETVFVKSGIMK